METARGGSPEEIWSEVLRLAEDSPSLRPLVAMLELEQVSEGVARLRARDPSGAAGARARLGVLEDLLRRATGQGMLKAAVEAPKEVDDGPEGTAEASSREGERHPLVRRARELFGSRLIEVQRLDRDGTSEAGTGGVADGAGA